MVKKRVLVAMSGGVDSSAAAVILQQQGYCCDGGMMALAEDIGHCTETIADARSVTDRLGITLHVFDETAQFRSCVVQPFISAYCGGQTPNPCILCNQALKFGVFLNRALEQGYDYIATGHYARVVRDESTETYRLLRGKDPRKDQSYVLYRLTQRQLAHLLLPIGEIDKGAVRSLLEQQQIPIAHKPDSQDICFIPDGDYVSFLERSGVTLTPGDYVDAAGHVLGKHRGLPCYTLGQGKGLGIALGRHVYVTEKNGERNTVTLGENTDLFRRTLTAEKVNWINGAPEGTVRCSAKTRYSQREAACTATPLPEGQLRVTFDEPQRAMTPGQAVVLYDGETVLGGGTIRTTED